MNYKVFSLFFVLALLVYPVTAKASCLSGYKAQVTSAAHVLSHCDCYQDDENPSGNASGLLIKYIKITSPFAGDVIGNGSYGILSADSAYPITWISTTGGIKFVDILYSADLGGSWNEIVTNYPNTGLYEWTLPTLHSDRVLLRINAYGADNRNFGSVISNSPFSVYNQAGMTQSTYLQPTPARIFISDCYDYDID